ncbi:hypothetical protein AGMMS49942_07690 [Spirochaetia bacterium]|nr:hypothetical protein AGMMS49942_07690 [Spirochaetia bacterium]
MSSAKPLAILLCAALISLCAHTAHAQSTVTPKGIPISDYNKAAKQEKPEFPQWVRDLRRAEIIAFGSFPFMMFLSTFSMDTYRFFTNDNNLQYAPWPFKGAGAVEMTTDEFTTSLFIAIGGSLAIALADHIIVRVKRAKAERQRLNLPEGEVIELRKPWPPEDSGVTELEDAGDTAPEADGTP